VTVRSDEILAQIDSTLEDWTVSEDAMRSRPAVEQPEADGPRLWIAPTGTDPGDVAWQEIGVLDVDLQIEQATIDPAALQPAPTVTWQELADYIAEIQAERARRAQQVIDALTRAFTEVVKPAAEAAARGLAQMQQTVEQAAPPLPPGRRHDRPAWQSPYGPPQRRR
jgi:hypothetical protein